MKKFFRIESLQTYCIGKWNGKGVGEKVCCVYATPHAECAYNILKWNDRLVLQYENYFADQVVLVIESTDFYHPEKNPSYCELTDMDEVIINDGVIVEVLTYHDFLKKYKDWE